MRAPRATTIRYVLQLLDGGAVSTNRHHEAAIADLRSCLRPKRSAAPARARKKAKDAERREEWKAIKAKVFERAGGVCEHCNASNSSLESDHMFSGSGRRVSLQSVYTVWALCPNCHWEKTNSRPSAAHWQQEFVNHCGRQNFAKWPGAEADGYAHAASIAQARLDSLTIQGRGGEMERAP